MDHKWGRLVFDSEFPDGGATLCAGFDMVPGLFVSNKPSPIPNTSWFHYLDPDTGVLIYKWVDNNPVDDRNFPYGWPVIPDGPV